ncbi:MAG: hypothetical protein ABWK05_05160 [Pyrobaculum sp.]
MGKVVRGLLVVVSILTAVVAVLSLVSPSLVPVKTSVSVRVVGPGGYVYPPGFLGFEFGPNGTILVRFSNGTVIDLTPTSGDQRYFKLFEAPLKQFKPDSPLIPIPTREGPEIRGWIVIRGVNVTLIYRGWPGGGTIMKDDKGYYVLYRWELGNATLQRIEALNKSLVEAVPAYIEAKVRVVPPSTAGQSFTAQVETVQTTFTGYNYLGVQLYNVIQSITFGYDGSKVVWESGSITCGGAGYSFYNTITANGVTYSGWGNLTTPSTPTNAPSGYLYETTGVYFGNNAVAVLTTSYYMHKSGWVYYTIGASSGGQYGYSGWVEP